VQNKSDMQPTFLGVGRPPCSKLLGWQLIEIDEQEESVTIRFDGKTEFSNSSGFIQGGILTAMLDDSIGPAILLATEGKQHSPTISMTVNFIAPARPGPLICKAKIIQKGKTIVFTEACLRNESGDLLVTASSTNRLLDADD
jgi:uncharacterized protein (TIGR00369 family)